jgi:hypothetical protein
VPAWVSRRAVHGWLLASGIERRPSGAGPVACDGDDPAALYRAGWSAPAIAERVGCSPSTISANADDRCGGECVARLERERKVEDVVE